MHGVIRVLELRSVRGTGGGPEKTILQGARRANRSEFDVTVCYLRDARDAIFTIDEQARALGVDYHDVIERHSFDPSVWIQLQKLVRRRNIHIVHAHEYKTDLIAWGLARTAGVAALATVHGWTGHSLRERRVYYPTDRWILKRFPRLIAVSNQIRDELIRAGTKPDRVVTVLNGIDPETHRRHASEETAIRHSHGITAGDIVIGSVGRLEPQKRFDLLIEAVARLRPRFSTLKLLIAGEGSERERLTLLINREALSTSCHLLGHRTDIATLHHAFDLYVQSSDYEGTPNAVLEAMALETPVVATDVGGTGEIVRDGVDGALVPAGDVDALVAAIDQTIRNPTLTSVRRASARTRVETDLSFDARTRTVENIYRELILNQ